MKRFIVVALCLSAWLDVVVAQPVQLRPSGSFSFNSDFARFAYSASESYLEIYYGFHPRLIGFEFKDEKYRGAVAIHTRLKNVATGDLEIDNQVLLPLAINDTSGQSLSTTFVTHAGYAVPHGSYVLDVAAMDTSRSDRIDTVRYSFSLGPQGTSMTTSDLELCSNIRNSTDTSGFFYKNTLEVVPNPTQVFGVANHPVMFYYLELYNIPANEQLTLNAQLVDGEGTVVRENSAAKSFHAATAIEAGVMNVSSMHSGKYILHVLVRDQKGDEVTRVNKPLYIYNPHIKTPEVTASEIIASEMSGLTEDELDAEFEQAQYVAVTRDITFYRQLTSADSKRQFLADFWTEVEGGKPGKISIRRNVYLDRVRTSSDKFRAFNRPGWKTDRGRVFVLYGEPDHTERVPSSEGAKPHETWHYYQIENGVQFVFIDRTGFGEYQLVHSTKRGELQDSNWERLLQ